MKIIYFYLIFLYLLQSCIPEYKVFRYNAWDISISHDLQGKISCVLKLQNNFKKVRSIYPDGRVEVDFIFEDSAKVYLTNSVITGTNKNAIHMVYNNIEFKVPHRDTLFLYGKQRNGMIWAEKAYPKIILGYFNVKQDRKKYYDEILNNIKCTCKR